ncbi:MAG: rod shape-determining protein MreD [Gemmatimonadota bacterium]|jgi:rod shape-determining protein MreD|nr:rod shape-determining protein MreD [Gemmatimonadota bacterium]
MARTLRSFLVFALLVSLHYGVRPLLPGRVLPDFLVIALLLAAVRLRPGASAVLGLLIGFTADALTPGAFGAAALAFTVVGFAASWLKAVFFADNAAINAVFFFAGAWVADVVFLLAARRLPLGEFVVQALVWSPLSAGLTAVVGVALLLVARPVLDAGGS